ncbi:MAG: tetratricopeptide repeat protein, partial [Candidatus Thiodiazotropha sp.]
LKRMLIWVERGDCPNYFIPGENMFEGRISEEMQRNLCGLLRRIIDANFKYLVSIKSDDLGDRYQEALVSGVLSSRYNTLGDLSCKGKMNDLLVQVLLHIVLLFSVYAQSQHTQIVSKGLYELKVRLVMSEIITEHTVEEVHQAVSLLVPYVDIQLMSLLVVLAKRRSKSRAFIFNLLTCEKWHTFSLESNMFSSKLKQASLLYMLEYYEMSLEVLGTLENQLEQTLSVCYCSRNRRPDATQLGRQLFSLPVSSCEEFLHRHVITCVIFLPAERLLTPPALCYEMDRSADSPPESKEVWYDWAVVDGKVLLYYLLYLNHSRLGLNANASADIDNIWWLIRTDPLLGHKETALNLLGWIYKERGLIDRAVECFRESLSIQPSHNAASRHLEEICRNRTRTC